MRPRSVEVFLSDIVNAAESIQTFVKDKTFADYQSDPLLRSAVERQYITIGEALNQAISLDPRIGEKITSTSQIIRLRHRLAHGYFTIAHETIWGIVEKYLETLIRETDALLRERDARL